MLRHFFTTEPLCFAQLLCFRFVLVVIVFVLPVFVCQADDAKAAPADDDDDDDGPELPLIAEEKVNPRKGPQRSALILDIVGDSPELGE